MGVGAEVGRVHEESFGGILGEVVGKDAFDDVSVFEFQANPQTFGAGSGGEGLAEHEVGVGELANEIDGLDVTEIDGDDVSGGVEEFEFTVDDEVRGGDVSADGVAVVFPHDNFFMSRRHVLSKNVAVAQLNTG